MRWWWQLATLVYGAATGCGSEPQPSASATCAADRCADSGVDASEPDTGASDAAGGSTPDGATDDAPFDATDDALIDEPMRVLLFTKTAGFRHASIPDAVAGLESVAAARGWAATSTEDASVFSDTGLSAFDVVVFLLTTGDVLDDAQQAAFEGFIRGGGGFVGVHSATDTEYGWAWYGELVGAYYRSHPDVQSASLVVEDPSHPSASSLPNPWVRSDEFYGFQSNPRSTVSVILSIDEASYSPGGSNMMGDHPIAWFHTFDGGRSFYTSLGHTSESYAEPLFLEHLAGGIVWAAG